MAFVKLSSWSQNPKLPDKPYELIIGKYWFVSETVIEKNPNLSEGFFSDNFSGLQAELPADSSNQEPVFP